MSIGKAKDHQRKRVCDTEGDVHGQRERTGKTRGRAMFGAVSFLRSRFRFPAHCCF